ncbi:MAG: enoyl-CoA hydratase/isomerase family protein [Acidimicrobiales bacterium]|jgi:2-(1,2-epoxy-1,2-dihydrophenyl)acetyl-CoA isomerase|nr:enoyl-CoA hydratase-related protein [Actinomycetota bacterium]
MSEVTNVDEDVVRRVEGGVAWLVLNRPDAGNAMTAAMRNQMSEWLEEASADLAVRVVVITANGEKAFCTGADLRGGRAAPLPRPEGAPANAVGDGARTIRNGWQRLVGAILDCEKPVIAGVNGTAAGGGMHLALACDLVVAAEEARFIEVFVRRGIAPDAGGAWLLTRLVGIQKAKELFFLGDDVSAREAHGLGLVNRVVARSELNSTLEELSSRLAKAPTKAIWVAKWLANRALDVDRATAFNDEAIAQELVTHTEDSTEGMMSFVERREPTFHGW